jgi:hypothetical protein
LASENKNGAEAGAGWDSISCHKPAGDYECDCPSGSGKYWTNPQGWICAIKSTTTPKTIKGFGIRAFDAQCSLKIAGNINGGRTCGKIDDIYAELTPFSPSPPSFTDNRYIIDNPTSPSGLRWDHCDSDMCPGTLACPAQPSNPELDADGNVAAAGQGNVCKRELKDAPNTNAPHISAWSRVNENLEKTININGMVEIKYRVVRMEVCDHLHKCSNENACSSEETVDGKIVRSGSVCTSKKAVVSCKVCGSESGCPAGGTNQWSDCTTDQASAAALAG